MKLEIPQKARVPIAALAIYCGLCLVNLLIRSPFAVSVDKACELGRWDREAVTFVSGSYGYRLLYSTAEAELRVRTEDGEHPVYLEMSSFPLGGWTVSVFDARAVPRFGAGRS